MLAPSAVADDELVPAVLREYGEATRAVLFSYLPSALRYSD